MVHIWFNLIVIHSGYTFWINSFENLDECQAVQAWYEEQEQYKNDKFLCPWVRVEKT
jgi:hypothetical protein